jgi:polyketide synthase 13
MLFGEYIRLMALVEYSAEEIAEVFSEYPDLEVCVYAAPTQTVIGGPPAQVDAIIERCEAQGRFARKFATKGASHTTQMDPLLVELAAELQGIEAHPLKIGYFSTVHEGGYIRPGGVIHGVDYWRKGLRHSVYFTQGIRNAVDNGHTTFVELAPNPVALMQAGLTTASAGLHDGQLVPTLARQQDEVDSMVSAMAQLYVHGHGLDFRTLFTPAAGPEDYADIPPTRFKRKEHWLGAQFSADGSSMIPGTHVAMADGRHVWEYAAKGTTDLAALVKSAAAQVIPDALLTASEQRAVPGDGARLVTTLTRHPGGASVQVHARIGESFTLVYDAVVARSGTPGAGLPAAVVTGVAVAPGSVSAIAEPAAAESVDDASILHDNLAAGAGVAASLGKWSAESGETVHDRLALIVGSAMGYEPEDLPWEVPLIELGLDSLMAVRIKNRVEYDFDMPPIQLTAVRDASLNDVEALITYAVEHRDEVVALHEHQKSMTAEEIAAEQTMLMAGEISPALAEKLAAKHPQVQPGAPTIPPPPTNPAGPDAVAPTAAGAAAKALTQQAVVDALGTDVPPREAAERITFATWAIVTGKSPGGIFNTLPEVDDDTAVKIAERLTERCEGTITVDDGRAATTIEELATAVREHLEAGELDGFVRTLRARKEGSDRIPVFVFHPAGGSTVVYEPLLKRLPADIPMYGLERVEGSIEERAAQYVPKLLELNGNGPFILAGWSLGGVLAYACAIGLKNAGADVAFVGLIDTVRAGEDIPQTAEEIRARWDRYALFAQRTFNVEIPAIPYEQLEQLDDAGQVAFVLDAVKQSGVDIPGGVIEHQRTSYLDNRAIDTAKIEPYDGHVTLYMADRYHDDAIMFEPRYATRRPDGGWGEFVADLEVVPIGGEHIQVIDEPYIAKVGAHLSEAISKIQGHGIQGEVK